VRRVQKSFEAPGYTLSSRKNFISDINHKFKMCKEILKHRLQSEEPCVPLTTDNWTSIDTEAYMTLTAHYKLEDTEPLY